MEEEVDLANAFLRCFTCYYNYIRLRHEPPSQLSPPFLKIQLPPQQPSYHLTSVDSSIHSSLCREGTSPTVTAILTPANISVSGADTTTQTVLASSDPQSPFADHPAVSEDSSCPGSFSVRESSTTDASSRSSTTTAHTTATKTNSTSTTTITASTSISSSRNSTKCPTVEDTKCPGLVGKAHCMLRICTVGDTSVLDHVSAAVGGESEGTAGGGNRGRGRKAWIEGLLRSFVMLGGLVEQADMWPSENEELSDVPTGSLRYLTIPFILGDLCVESEIIDMRLNRLRQAKLYFGLFMNTMEQLEIGRDIDLLRWRERTAMAAAVLEEEGSIETGKRKPRRGGGGDLNWMESAARQRYWMSVCVFVSCGFIRVYVCVCIYVCLFVWMFMST
eukprot:GHVQ01021832.1.p1 GENE.GHVQ01021832.1~~GHVQ01021832.1.p1  ORF type:complete len:390 (+),score=75.50 GHVQ01021832.1:281-1450(+)